MLNTTTNPDDKEDLICFPEYSLSTGTSIFVQPPDKRNDLEQQFVSDLSHEYLQEFTKKIYTTDNLNQFLLAKKESDLRKKKKEEQKQKQHAKQLQMKLNKFKQQKHQIKHQLLLQQQLQQQQPIANVRGVNSVVGGITVPLSPLGNINNSLTTTPMMSGSLGNPTDLSNYSNTTNGSLGLDGNKGNTTNAGNLSKTSTTYSGLMGKKKKKTPRFQKIESIEDVEKIDLNQIENLNLKYIDSPSSNNSTPGSSPPVSIGIINPTNTTNHLDGNTKSTSGGIDPSGPSGPNNTSNTNNGNNSSNGGGSVGGNNQNFVEEFIIPIELQMEIARGALEIFKKKEEERSGEEVAYVEDVRKLLLEVKMIEREQGVRIEHDLITGTMLYGKYEGDLDMEELEFMFNVNNKKKELKELVY